MNASDAYQQGNLSQAIELALAEVKSRPSDAPARLFLAELCCFAGDYERAEKQLDVITQQTTEAALLISLFRQLLRGETARQQVLAEGRPPEIVTPLTPAHQLQLEVLTAYRLGHAGDAAEKLAALEGVAPVARGECNGEPFEGIRDLDDRTACALEVITSNGKYYWVGWESLEYLEFQPPQRPLDLLFRRTQISVRGGPEGEVFLPTRYISPRADQSDALKLGRATEWLGNEGEVMAGQGLKTWLVGDRDLTILELESLQFEPLAS